MLLKDIGDVVPARTKQAWVTQMIGTGVVFMPGVGLVHQGMAELIRAHIAPADIQIFGPVVGGSIGLFYAAKALQLFKKKDEVGLWIGDMWIPEKAFWTSLLITGRPGSGKTSGAIMPVAEQFIKLYSGPDYIDDVVDGVTVQKENPLARCGGTVLEVKGEFYEMIGYLLHLCKRNVYEDFLIIRPDSSIPVAKFEEMDAEFKTPTGRYYYVNALPCSSGSEAGRLLIQAQKAVPREKRIREDILSCESKELNHELPRLRDIKFKPDANVYYLGWRKDGNRLVRVTHTSEYEKVEYAQNIKGEKIYSEIPRYLRFVDKLLFSNGLLYNLIDPNVGANEAAEKLARMASVSGRGEGKGGDNSYWYSNAQRLIAACISLRRAIHPDLDVTCADIYRMVADKPAGKAAKSNTVTALSAKGSVLQQDLAELEKKLIALRQEINNETDEDKKNEVQRRTIEPLVALGDYFAGEWVNLDEKTKGIIKTVVSNTFSNFVFDPALNETFCSTSTFGFADCIQRGRLFCFVPGPKYENLAKVIGTGLKLDFQTECLQRLQRADYNKARAILHLTDECWNWVISGGSSGGDPRFLSLCRQARVFNLLATQNYNQFVAEIGRDNTLNFLGQFGCFLWLQVFDKMTNDMAEELMETVKREKVKSQGGDVNPLNIMDQHKAATVEVTYEEKKLFTSHDFVKLAGDEGIAFNGYRTREMAVKTTLQKSFLTSDGAKKPIAEFMRQLLRGSVEQALFHMNRTARLDHCAEGATASAEKVAEAKESAAKASAVAPVAQPTPAVMPQAQAPVTQPAQPVQPKAPETQKPANQAVPPVTPIPDVRAVPQKPASTPTVAPDQEPQPKFQTRPANKTPSSPEPPPATTQPKKAEPASQANAPLAQATTLPDSTKAQEPAAAPEKKPAPRPVTNKMTFKVMPASDSAVNNAGTEQTSTPQVEKDVHTPKQIDAQSAAFVAMRDRLAVAASELMSDDDLGLKTWVQELLKSNKSGENIAPMAVVGPAGISAGDPKLINKAAPIPQVSLDRLTSSEASPAEARKRRSEEIAYSQRPGPTEKSMRW